MSFSEWFKEFIEFCHKNSTMNKGIDEHTITNNLLNSMGDKLNKLSNKMLRSVTHMPYLKDLPEVIPVYNYIRYVSLSLTGCVVGYKGLKLLFSNNEMDKVESKRVFSRLFYSLTFSGLSLKFIDLLILGNNTLSAFILSKFNIDTSTSLLCSVDDLGLLIPTAFFLIQILEIIKILVGFWMRMAELVFAGIISPVMFTLWINNEWSGYLKNWVKRVSVLVFTQITLVLILIIYSMMLKGWLLSNTLNGICLTIATLFLLDKGPKILQNFASNSEYNDAKSTINKIIHSKVARTIKRNKK